MQLFKTINMCASRAFVVFFFFFFFIIWGGGGGGSWGEVCAR